MAQEPPSADDIPIQVLAPPTYQGGHVIPSTPTLKTSKSPSQSNESLEPPKTETNKLEENEGDHFLTGFKLYLVVGGVMLVGFLLGLNGSFVATVSLFSRPNLLHTLICFICLELSSADGSGACTGVCFYSSSL
jgi:hypothetical protein